MTITGKTALNITYGEENIILYASKNGKLNSTYIKLRQRNNTIRQQTLRNMEAR